MSIGQRRIFSLLLLISALALVMFAVPDYTASENMAMVQMFEPDEASPLPFLFRMIAPSESIEQALRSFVFYEFYYYGFPHFAYSAFVILPLKWFNQLDNLPLVMMVLRLMGSTLPLLVSLLLLVYMQDGFHTYRSVVLYVLLLGIPAVWSNNYWWHPDGLTMLAVVGTLFFLQRDRLRFGANFLLAAVSAAIAVAIKLIGLYFFLAVALTIVLGGVLKTASWRRIAVMSISFIVVLALVFVITNPFLLSSWGRADYIDKQMKTTFVLSFGYGVEYAKGLVGAWPVMNRYYGGTLFLLVSLGCAVWVAFYGKRRLLSALILTWFLPLTVSLLVMIHMKFQYWMPAALPLISCLIVLLPEHWKEFRITDRRQYLALASILVVLVQFVLFTGSNVNTYVERVSRAKDNPRIAFYHLAIEALQPLPPDDYSLYYDYRLYMPDTPGFTKELSYVLLEYGYIQDKDFDVLFLLQQRINDYLHPDVTGIDPVQFAQNQRFYHDANNGAISGYRLTYRDDTGLVYVREDLYEQNFSP
jgi:hypothetical protein